MSTPSIKTTVVGSYPVPEWLRAIPSTPALRDAILVVLKTQELAGLDVIADGELSRFNVNHPETNGMIEYFITPLAGIHTDLTRAEREAFSQQAGMGFRRKPAGVVRAAIGEGALDLRADFDLVRPLTKTPLKFTITSPYMLAKTLLDQHYGDFEGMLMDIARVLRAQAAEIPADCIQIDEANIPGAPEQGAIAARAINEVLADAKTERAVHLCFGNYGGQTIQKGAYEKLAGDFLNTLECDHVVLEVARRPVEELAFLKDITPSIKIGIGVIDIKDNEVEPPDTVAERIERACETLGPDRVAWVHPDCGFWMLPRTVADRKMEALVKGRDLYLG